MNKLYHNNNNSIKVLKIFINSIFFNLIICYASENIRAFAAQILIFLRYLNENSFIFSKDICN